MAPEQRGRPTMLDRLDRVEHDLQGHAKTISELVLNEARRKDREVSSVEIDKLKEEHLDERLKRIESSVNAVYTLGKWLLAAVGTGLVAAVVTFIVNGGLHIG